MGSFDYSSWAAQALQEADDATYALNPRGFGSDVGTALKQGVLGLPSMVTGLADIPLGLLGANRPISAAATRLGELTGIEPAKWAKLLDQNYSRATQEGKRDIQAVWDDPKAGALDIAKAYASNPRTTALNAIESVPSMAAGWGMGGLLGKAAGITSSAVRAGIGEGSVGAGQMMAQIDPTVDPQIAALASLAVGGGAAAISGGSARLAQKLGISDIDAMAVGGVRGASDVSLPAYKRIPIGMLQEGLVEEGSQSGLEQLSQNWAENKPLTQGLARNILEGTLAGSPFGAIGGAIPTRSNERPEIKPEITPPLQIGFNPMAGVPIVFPDGSVTLNSEQELAKRYTPVVSKPPLSTTEDIANRVNSNEATLDVVTSGNQEHSDAQDRLQKQMKEYVDQAESEIKKTRAEFGLDKKEATPPIERDPVQTMLDQATNLIGAPNASTTSTVLPADSIAADVGTPDTARGVESRGSSGYGPDVAQSAVNSGMLEHAPIDPAGILANAVNLLTNQENANEKATQTNANEGQETGQKEALLTPEQVKPISELTGQPVAESQVPAVPDSGNSGVAPTQVSSEPIESQQQEKSLVPTSAKAVESKSPQAPQEATASAVAPSLTARQAAILGEIERAKAKTEAAKAARGENAKPVVLSVGRMQNSAEPVTVKDGIIHIGKYPAQNFDTGEDVPIKANATPQEIAQALRDSGAIGTRSRIFGLEKQKPIITVPVSQRAQEQIAPTPDLGHIGRDNTALIDGGKPFKAKADAQTAKKQQPMMRVLKVDGGFVLAPKTDAQIKANEAAAKRLSIARTGQPGVPIAAHEFIAGEGGLNPSVRSDLGVEGNPRIGNRRLYARAGTGLTLEQSTQKLLQDGYLKQGQSQNEALTLIKRSLTQHQYTPEGFERIAEAQQAQEYQDHLKAEQEAAQSEDFDPFQSVADLGFELDDAEFAGYNEAQDPIKIEVNALLAQADSLGIDTDSIKENAHENTREGSEQDYFEAARDALKAAIETSNGNRSEDAGAQGSAGEQSLTSPTRQDVLDQQARQENAAALDNKAQIDKESAGQTLTRQVAPEQRRDTSGDMFAKEKAQAEIDKRNSSGTVSTEPDLFAEPSNPIAAAVSALQGAVNDLAKAMAPDKMDGVKAKEETEPTQSAQPTAKPSGKIDGEVYSATGSKPTVQLPISRIEQIVKEITAKVSGSIPILVVESPESIGLTVAPDVVASGVTLADGNIYVFQSGVGSVLDVQRVVFHELFHRGLQNVMSPTDYLATMLDLAAKDSRVQEYANNWKNSNSGTDQLAKYKEQGLTGAELNNRHEGLAIEEGLAQVAEELKSDGEVGTKYKHIQKLLSWIAGVADKLGMSKLAKSIRVLSYSDAEKFVVDMIGKSGGVAQYGSGIRLSAKNAPTSIPAHLVDMAAHYGGNTGLQAATDATNIVSKAIDMMTSLPDIIRRYKDQLPSAKEWHDAMLVKEERKNAIKQMVDAVAAQVSKLSAKEYDVVNAFVYDSTFQQKWGYDPEFKRKTTVDPEFKARFDSLSPAVQKVAKDIFAHGEYVRNTQRAIMDALKISDVFLTKKQLEGPYAALRRFGDYAVVLKSDKLIAAETKAKGTDPNSDEHQALDELKRSGDDYSYSRFDTAGQAAVFLKEQLATGKFKGYTFPHKHGLDTPMTMPADVLRRVLASINADTNTSDDIRNVMVENIKGMYFRTMEDRLARQAQQQRKYIRGADTNMIRSFMAQGEADANFLSILEHGGEVNSAIYQVQKEGDKGSKENKKIADLVIAHHIEASKPKMSPIQDRLVAATSAMQLSSSLGYHLSNMTQVVQVSLPKLAAEFNDYQGAWNAVTNGYKLYHGITSGNILSGKTLDLSKVKNEGLRNVLQHAIDRQLLDVGMEGDLTQFDRFQTGYSLLDGTSSIASKALYKLRQISRGVELMNRIATTAAAYSMYMEKRGSEPGASAKAQDFAVEMLETTQGDMSGLAAPLAIKKLPKVMVQYRKYQLMMAALYVDGFNKAFRGETPEVRALGRRFLAYKLFHTGMAAGVLGMPMLNIVGPAFAFLFGDDDEPKDFERMMRDLIGNTALSDLLLHGPLSLMGLDTSAKLGDEKVFSIMPFTDIDVTSKKGLALTAIGLLGGPAFGQAAHMADGVGMMGQGEYYKGIEKFLPKGLEDAMKGFRMANDGYTLKNGDVMVRPEDISGVALALQTLGLPPTEIKRYQWFQSQQIEITRFFSDQEKRMKKNYSDAKESGDSDSQEKIKEDWRQLQGGKAKARRYFNDSPDELKPRDMSALTNYYTYQSKREKSLQRSIPVSAD